MELPQIQARSMCKKVKPVNYNFSKYWHYIIVPLLSTPIMKRAIKSGTLGAVNNDLYVGNKLRKLKMDKAPSYYGNYPLDAHDEWG